MRRTIEKDAIHAWLHAISTVKADSKNAGLWKQVGRIVTMPKRERVAVNLSKLEKMAKDGEFVIVPGKVLSFGNVSHKFKIAAVEYSETAAHKLKGSGCEMVAVDQMTKKENPRIIM